MRQPLWVVLGVVASLISVGLAGGGAFVTWRLIHAHAARSRPVVYSPAAHPKTPWHGTVSSTSGPSIDDEDPVVTPHLPEVKRSIPVFNARLLTGCSKADLDSIETGIADAVGVGAPLYNQGDFDGCYKTYESAARSIERDLGKTCKGPAGALAASRARAATRKTAADKAWAMRDGFDGLLDVIDRKGMEL
jgi:hypothetical protein